MHRGLYQTLLIVFRVKLRYILTRVVSAKIQSHDRSSVSPAVLDYKKGLIQAPVGGCDSIFCVQLWCCNLGRVKRIWYLSPMRAVKVQASLRIRAVLPEPPLLAHTSSESRGTFRQKARSLWPLKGWACAVKICHDGMLKDTNSVDGAHLFMWYLHDFESCQVLCLKGGQWRYFWFFVLLKFYFPVKCWCYPSKMKWVPVNNFEKLLRKHHLNANTSCCK